MADRAIVSWAAAVARFMKLAMKPVDESTAPGPFDSTAAAVIDLAAYAERLATYTYCSGAVHTAALVYVDRLCRYSAQSDSQIVLTERSAHRLYGACLYVAAKFWEDCTMPHAFWAKAAGLCPSELQKLEVTVLSGLKFELDIKPSDGRKYQQAVSVTEAHRARSLGLVPVKAACTGVEDRIMRAKVDSCNASTCPGTPASSVGVASPVA
mmetsp:Transcript_2690/g.6037  ORF Transcript_2690/g.6037 Transcript_2690/m.6037 type:complete len:210 (-) Transcript_2690:430-1059(-)